MAKDTGKGKGRAPVFREHAVVRGLYLCDAFASLDEQCALLAACDGRQPAPAAAAAVAAAAGGGGGGSESTASSAASTTPPTSADATTAVVDPWGNSELARRTQHFGARFVYAAQLQRTPPQAARTSQEALRGVARHAAARAQLKRSLSGGDDDDDHDDGPARTSTAGRTAESLSVGGSSSGGLASSGVRAAALDDAALDDEGDTVRTAPNPAAAAVAADVPLAADVPPALPAWTGSVCDRLREEGFFACLEHKRKWTGGLLSSDGDDDAVAAAAAAATASCAACAAAAPSQLILNEYQPGQGIGPHVDHACFGPVVASLSLGSGAVMRFTRPPQRTKGGSSSSSSGDISVPVPKRASSSSSMAAAAAAGAAAAAATAAAAAAVAEGEEEEPKAVDVFLRPGSMVVLTGQARTDWRHSIPARRHDPDPDAGRSPGKHRARQRRVSLTFRTVVPHAAAAVNAARSAVQDEEDAERSEVLAESLAAARSAGAGTLEAGAGVPGSQWIPYDQQTPVGPEELIFAVRDRVYLATGHGAASARVARAVGLGQCRGKGGLVVNLTAGAAAEPDHWRLYGVPRVDDARDGSDGETEAADGSGRGLPVVEVDYAHADPPLHDQPGEDIRPTLDRVLPLVDAHLARGGPVVVHCRAGLSRSATVVVAWLMQRHGMNLAQAVAAVSERRGRRLQINPSYWMSLARLERELQQQQQLGRGGEEEEAAAVAAGGRGDAAGRPPPPSFDFSPWFVEGFGAMGFDEAAIRAALLAADWVDFEVFFARIMG